MKDCKQELHEEYFRLLSGEITVGSETIAVYDSVPSNATYPYVKIGEWTEIDWSTKSNFGAEVTITIQIVDRFQNSITRSRLYSVLNQMKQIIRARPVPFDADSFNIIQSVVDNETTFRQATDTYVYLYSNVRFRHQAEELQLT